MTNKQIRTEIRKLLDGLKHHPPFDRPLRFGDAQQIRILNLLNGDEPFCPGCWESPFADWQVGESCPRCGRAKILPGSRMNVKELCQEAAC